ncbi:predicted protein, partial [Arabidopsis lyrata subsp. lyrata]
GTLIHATIKKQQLNKLQRFITSGEWRIIEKFTLAKSTGKYRATKHGFKMSMMQKTVITRTPPLSNDIYLDLANFQDVLDEGGLNENILIGERSVSNAFDMSLLEINATYPAVLEFVANLPPDAMPLAIQEVKPKHGNQLMKKKEYYDRFPRKTISGLFCFSEIGKCNIIVTIMKIDTDYSWYFFCCLKCHKTAYKIPKVENEIAKK